MKALADYVHSKIKIGSTLLPGLEPAAALKKLRHEDQDRRCSRHGDGLPELLVQCLAHLEDLTCKRSNQRMGERSKNPAGQSRTTLQYGGPMFTLEYKVAGPLDYVDIRDQYELDGRDRFCSERVAEFSGPGHFE